MRGTIVRIGAAGAGALLALGLFIAPPAGAAASKRQGPAVHSASLACFNTEGRFQGRSYSDPDGMSNGGPDKPGCNGGFDADKDGNNGCGNDADREDDNNGNCGRKKAQGPETTPAPANTTVSAAASTNSCGTCPEDTEGSAVSAAGVMAQAAGSVPEAGVAAEAATTTATPAPTNVLGSSLASVSGESMTSPITPATQVRGETRSLPGILARTGLLLGGLALLGALLCGGGRLPVLARRLLRIG